MPAVTKIIRPLILLLLPLATIAMAAPFWEAHRIADQFADQIRLEDKNGKLYAMVKRDSVQKFMAAKKKVENAAGPIRATYFLDAEKKPNAFATYANGQPIIAINIGMLQLLDDDEEAYAALAGHELAHLYLKHPEKYSQRNGLKQVGSTLLGFALSYAGVPAGGTIAEVATTAISTVHSRDDERESDELGMKFMLQAGFDPYGTVRLQEKLASTSGISIPFLSTHPSSEERITNMRKLAEIAQASKIGSKYDKPDEKSVAIPQDSPNSPSPLMPATPASFAKERGAGRALEDSTVWLNMSLASAVNIGVMTSVAANIYAKAVQDGTVSRTDLVDGLAADYGIGGSAAPFIAPANSTESDMAAAMPELAKQSNCTACHSIDKKKVGPAWYDVALRYRSDPNAEVKLIYKVANGGNGVWGDMPEIPNSRKVSSQNIKALVKFILSLNPPTNYVASDTALNPPNNAASRPFNAKTLTDAVTAGQEKTRIDAQKITATPTADTKPKTNTVTESAILQKLRELQSLKKEGVITESEFQEKKDKLLEQH